MLTDVPLTEISVHFHFATKLTLEMSNFPLNVPYTAYPPLTFAGIRVKAEL